MKWITREKIKVDRVACPWLIKKFIDQDAEFVFLRRDTDWKAIGDGIVFDVPDCELGHHGEDVSFNSILKKYKLTDPALVLLGEIVRAADSHPTNPHPALEGLGATVFVIGLYDALRTLLGAIYAYPGGVLVDRWGHRQSFIIFNVVSIVGYLIVLLIPHWAAVIAGMFLFLSWTCFSLPATFSLVGAALEANRHSMGVGVQSVIKRLPIMIAPFFGGMLIDRFGIINGVRLALIMSVLFSAVTILVQLQLREEPKQKFEKNDR